MNELSPAQQTYAATLNAIETERLAALNTPGANAERLAIIALRKMSAAYVKLRAAQLEAPRS
jgi:hypothetical protein